MMASRGRGGHLFLAVLATGCGRQRTYEPYWLEINNGGIVRIEEQYLP